MLSQSEALIILKKSLPGYPIKSWADYGDLFLFKVEHPDLFEKDFDPFFSVDKLTGEASDFSILTDGNTSEIINLKWIEL